MEIKQGDKVRVSKDAPRIYTPDWVDEMFNLVLKVAEVEDGNAMVVFAERTPYKTVLTTIPCKYLIKVDAEAKEAKFKKGDRVKYVGKEHPEYWGEVFTVDGEIFYNDYHKNMQISSARCEKYNICNVPLSDLVLYAEPTAPTIKVGDRVRCKNPIRLANSTDDDFIGTVTDAENGWFIVHLNNGAVFQTYHESDLELVQPTEQTEASTDVLGEFTPISMSTNPIIGFEQAYWQEYEADLAKEIALKVANKYNDPEQAAEYAVKVAKAVVEKLKNEQI